MLQILSWNIRQGGGSRIQKIAAALIGFDAGVIVLSEYRNNRHGLLLRGKLMAAGYLHQQTGGSSQDTNAVLIAAKFPFSTKLFPEADKNFPYNVLRADFDAFQLYGMYLPHKKKHKLFELLKAECASPVPGILAGDFNTGINYIDQEGNSFWYTDDLDKLSELGYVDAYRLKNGGMKEYSWYSHQGNGYRYDHTWVHESLTDLISEVYYLHEWRVIGLSDHAPMVLKIG